VHAQHNDNGGGPWETRDRIPMKIAFPHRGYHKGAPTTAQPEGTSPRLNNVRSYDSLDDRARGGQRPGVDKWSTTQVSGVFDSPIVEMVQVTIVES